MIGGRYAIPADTADHRAHPGAAPRPGRLGAGRGGVQPRPHGARAAGRDARRTPTSRSAPGSGPASGGSSRCRRRRWCSGMLLQRFDLVDHLRLPAARRRPRSPSSPTTSASRSGRGPACTSTARGPPSQRRTRSAAARGAGAGAALLVRPARHAAVGAVRLQPRHRRVHRHPARPGGHRARLRRDPRRARRPRRRPARAAAPSVIVCCVLQRDAPGQRRRVLPVDQRRRRRTRPTGCPTPCSAAATPSGPRPTRRCRRCSTTQLEAHGGPRVHPRGEGNAAGDFDAAVPRLARRPVGRPRRGARPAGRGRRPPAPPGPRLSITLDQPAGDQPGDRLLPGPPGAGPGEPRADRAGTAARRRSGRPATSRSRCPPGTAYRAGDHLGVLPRNSVDLIRRVMARFGLDAGQYLTIIPNSGTHTHLPIDEPAPLLGVLGSCVELQDVAGRDDIAVLARLHRRPAAAGRARGAGRRRRGVAGALPRAGRTRPTARCSTCSTQFPACRLPFEEYLDLLPAAAPALLLHLLLAAGEPGRLQHHRRGAARPGPVRRRHVHRASAPGYLAQLPDDGTVFVFVRAPSDRRSGRRRTRTSR